MSVLLFLLRREVSPPFVFVLEGVSLQKQQRLKEEVPFFSRERRGSGQTAGVIGLRKVSRILSAEPLTYSQILSRLVCNVNPGRV